MADALRRVDAHEEDRRSRAAGGQLALIDTGVSGSAPRRSKTAATRGLGTAAAGPVQTVPVPSRPTPQRAPVPRLCAWCHSKEARYGFRDREAGEARFDRPRALCFECFRAEIGRRQALAARLARGWNAEQTPLPLDETLQELHRRRRRAQIAARRALGA